jgi:MFS family permease
VIKFGTAISFCIVYVLTTELYPTEIRGLAFGLSNTFGRIGTIFATMMTETSPRIYFLINTGLSISVILVTFFLKETKGIELLDKISQQEEFDNKNKVMTAEEVIKIQNEQTEQREAKAAKKDKKI